MGGYISIAIDSCYDCCRFCYDIYKNSNVTRRNVSTDLPLWSHVHNPYQSIVLSNNNIRSSTNTTSLIESNRSNNYNTINNDSNEFTKCYNLIERYYIGHNTSSYYICQRKRDEQEYLCKVIHKTNNCINNDSTDNDDNNTEIKLLKLLNHPNIIKLEDFYDCIGDTYIVFEPLKGGELFQYIIEKGTLTEEDASMIIRKIASAIAYLHSLDIVHRDIKAESFLLTSKSDDWDIKLTDFGCAKELSNMSNSLVGSKGYIAPEILQRIDYNKAVDIWALGIISYLIICGSFPFDDSTAKIPSPSAARKKFQLRFPSWSNNVSASAKDLLHNVLEVDADCRYTAKQILQHPWISGKSLLKNNTLQSPVYLAEKNADVFRKPLQPFLSESKKSLQIAKIQKKSSVMLN